MPWTEDDIKGPTRALIIASSVESCFCAGADLKELARLTDEQMTNYFLAVRDTFKALAGLPIPVISAIGSCALGSGFELALASHFRVISSNASLALPETGLGIIPAAGGTYRLAALVGDARAREIVMTSRQVEAREAYTLGIASRLVEVTRDEVDEDTTLLAVAKRKVLVEAIRLAEEVCEGAPVAVRAALKALNAPGEDSEKAMFDRVAVSDDWHEAVRAFSEKRRPVFKGR
ncbi:ClpP/crotonase-like domain-containing protein [Coniella lustricola]|uniref:ClpP/crotonase-like domain-containing protein n=1 Tax=Coniella lustricola TaxID=2025994 RepID=A0A2T3A1J4_9PEZI|nr:ClpP/crotonase-like domain-containing protein [Coniella lustricola]